jgi:hypothetical protein
MNKTKTKLLCKAIEERDEATVFAILDDESDAIEAIGAHNQNVRDKTPFMYAMQCSDLQLANALLDRGANAAAFMTGGPCSSALSLCMQFAYCDVDEHDEWIRLATRLLDEGADPNTGLWPALHTVSRSCQRTEILLFKFEGLKMDASELLDVLAVRIFEPPLASFRDDGRIADTSNPLSVVMLLLDYETECSMNGIIGYLDNSSGQYLSETIDALDTIGCADNAKILKRIRATAGAGGMTSDEIHQDNVDLEPFTVTSFADLHGDQWDDICDRIEALHDAVDWNAFWKAMTAFVSEHKDVIQNQL